MQSERIYILCHVCGVFSSFCCTFCKAYKYDHGPSAFKFYDWQLDMTVCDLTVLAVCLFGNVDAFDCRGPVDLFGFVDSMHNPGDIEPPSPVPRTKSNLPSVHVSLQTTPIILEH